MSALSVSKEFDVMDRTHPLADDLGLVARGKEFVWEGPFREFDLSDLECQPLLASDLPLNSELQSLNSTALL